MTDVPLVVFADVSAVLIDFIKARVAATDPMAQSFVTGTEVHSKVPDPRPKRLILIRRVGGTSPRLGIDHPLVDVQVWHESDTEADDLTQLVRGWLRQARGTGPIRGVSENAGPVAIPDEDGTDRYLLTYDVTLKGATR